MAENRVQIVIDGDATKAVKAAQQTRLEYDILNTSLRTGIQEAAYGINAGTTSIVNSYVKMHAAARREMSQLTNETVKDAITMNERIRQLDEENKRREAAVRQTPDDIRAKWGLSPRDNQARLDAGLPAIDQQADAIRETNQGISDQTVAVGGADRYRESVEKISLRSTTTGINTGQIQDLTGAAKASGVDPNTMLVGYKNVTEALSDMTSESNKAKAALEAMGVSLVTDSGQAKTFSETMSEVAEKFRGYEDGANKAALANDIFGSSEGLLISLLNKGGPAFAEYLRLNYELDAKLSDLEIKKQQREIDSLRITQAARSAAMLHADQAFTTLFDNINSGLITNIGNWQAYQSQFSGIADGIASLWHAAVERIRVDFGKIPQGAINLQGTIKGAGQGGAGWIF
ncbi:MAG: hypothetical protein WAW37_06920 [Syntrophobacteraceae bacterium]